MERIYSTLVSRAISEERIELHAPHHSLDWIEDSAQPKYNNIRKYERIRGLDVGKKRIIKKHKES